MGKEIKIKESGERAKRHGPTGKMKWKRRKARGWRKNGMLENGGAQGMQTRQTFDACKVYECECDVKLTNAKVKKRSRQAKKELQEEAQWLLAFGMKTFVKNKIWKVEKHTPKTLDKDKDTLGRGWLVRMRTCEQRPFNFCSSFVFAWPRVSQTLACNSVTILFDQAARRRAVRAINSHPSLETKKTRKRWKVSADEANWSENLTNSYAANW